MNDKNIYDAKKIKELADKDLIGGLKDYHLWWTIAKMSIKERFRRTVIGPLWITLSLVIWVTMLTMINFTLFKKSPIDAVPLLIVSMIFWTFLSTILTEGCISLIIIELAIQEPPALPTSPVLVLTATIEKVA